MELDPSRKKAINKAGWEKIQFCADQAEKDGLQYFWIDTCCIDKKNAVELGATINSMFQWYQDAARCYVYLSDVSNPNPGMANDWMWKESFKASRWFTRGWTLQELIAPLHVRFFSEEGNSLGTKSSLEQDIHEVTRIPVQALRRSRISEFEVKERMKWTARRQTTIEEDQVYCLLGIFEIFIPPIYGERKVNALARLQEVIERRAQPQVQKRPREIGYVSAPSKRTSPYNRFPSLPSLQPVLDIPTKQIETVLSKLPLTQHLEIAEIVAANCKLAADHWYWMNGCVKHSAVSHLPAADVSLLAWISSFEKKFLEPKSNGPRYQRNVRNDGEDFYDSFDIPKLLDPWKRLNALEVERSLCCAIVWCRRLQDAECQARLASRWVELHPTTLGDKWTINLERAKDDVKDAAGKSGLDRFLFPKRQLTYVEQRRREQEEEEEEEG